MTINEAREYYRAILKTLKAERMYREKFLAEPRFCAALAEIDAALVSLERLGQIVKAASEAGLLDGIMEQAALFDLPERPKYS